MSAQEAEETKVENATHYLSKRMLEHEIKYIETEKLCLTLFWARMKLQHYLSSYTTYVIAEMSPSKFLMERPVLFASFDLKFVDKKLVKSGGQSLNQLAELPVENQLPGAEFSDGDILDVKPEV